MAAPSVVVVGAAVVVVVGDGVVETYEDPSVNISVVTARDTVVGISVVVELAVRVVASVAGDIVVCGGINSINSTMPVDGRATSPVAVDETTG